jgi:hypothetical protein
VVFFEPNVLDGSWRQLRYKILEIGVTGRELTEPGEGLHRRGVLRSGMRRQLVSVTETITHGRPEVLVLDCFVPGCLADQLRRQRRADVLFTVWQIGGYTRTYVEFRQQSL